MTRKFQFALLLVLAVVLVGGCGKKVDVEKLRAELRATDSAWSASTNDADAFAGFVAPNGSIMPPNAPAVVGTGNVRDWIAGMMAMPDFSVSWQVSSVDVAASGDIGYTTGTYDMSMRGPDGMPIKDHGKYLTVWTHTPDGTWKAQYDQFNSDIAPPAPEETPEEESWTNDK